MSRSRVVSLVVGIYLVISCASAADPASAGIALPRVSARIGPRLERALRRAGTDRKVAVIVHLRSHADLASIHARSDAGRLRHTVVRLRSAAASAQSNLLSELARMRQRDEIASARSLWVIDAVAVRATPGAIETISTRADVRSISLDASVAAPASIPEPNISVIGAPSLWSSGYTGQGVVIANMDTGVDVTHPDLAATWRGGSDSWFDPSGQHPSTPTDLVGHGTSTMGLMVGGDGGGTSIGVAPGARWIAAKIFNDQGVASTSGIHAAFQWLLDPDGNVQTPDAPDIVEGSWTLTNPGCDLTFEPDLEALRTAGILPVFAAGNGGPSSSSSFSPGDNPAAISVGATDNSDVVASFSSRGPSACGGRTGVFPDLVAPGVGVRTTDLYGGYTQVSGTSLAAPHVAGALALLMEAFPTASASDLESAVLNSAVDLGATGPDDVYGNGRLDVAAAYGELASAAPTVSLLSIHAGAGHTLGSVAGVQKKDVVSFDGSTYAMVFDGSDVGLGSVNLDALEQLDESTLLMSFDKPVTLAGVGTVDDSDVVRFAASSLGATTAGTFSMWFDGSDVGLTTDAEDVDALAVLGDGRVVLSTLGNAAVTGLATAEDEDLIAFTPTSLGSTTAGTFAMYLDGSDVGLSASTEDVDAVSIRATGEIDLSTTGVVSVVGVAGDGDDVITCMPTTLGDASSCNYVSVPVLDGSAVGLAGLGVDAFVR